MAMKVTNDIHRWNLLRKGLLVYGRQYYKLQYGKVRMLNVPFTCA